MMMKLRVVGDRLREEDTWGGTNRKTLIAAEAFIGLSAFASGVAFMLVHGGLNSLALRR
jgi:hypothetical protein